MFGLHNINTKQKKRTAAKSVTAYKHYEWHALESPSPQKRTTSTKNYNTISVHHYTIAQLYGITACFYAVVVDALALACLSDSQSHTVDPHGPLTISYHVCIVRSFLNTDLHAHSIPYSIPYSIPRSIPSAVRQYPPPICCSSAQAPPPRAVAREKSKEIPRTSGLGDFTKGFEHGHPRLWQCLPVLQQLMQVQYGAHGI